MYEKFSARERTSGHRAPNIAQRIVQRSKNGNKTAKINVYNFLGSLTTVVRAQNDTSKTANITYTIFDRTLV